MALTEEQFRGFLRLNFQTKEDFDTEIPRGNNPGGGKCCDFLYICVYNIHFRVRGSEVCFDQFTF